ncbi:MAG TPA: diacylglycerol kinase family protein [Longimicrobiales bacterium]|nr:diacylglycerol kinase family protein [Longimicrobiales bacterium]
MRIILNPMARYGAGARLRRNIERALERRRVPFDLVLTEGPGHATELAREAAAAGITRIIAAGGDGTIHEVANGIVTAPMSGVAMGLIPIGTGNDFVKMFPGVRSRDAAIALLASGTPCPVDVGIARWDGGTEYFINAMGTGIDVEVVRQMRRSRYMPGAAIYVGALLRALAAYRPLKVEVTVDDCVVSQPIMNLAVCNGPSIGGSFRICPDASPADGALDVCLIREMPMLRNARMVPRVIRGTHTDQTGVTMLRGTSVGIRLPTGGRLHFQLDGELREAQDGQTGIEITLAPARLNVIRGAPHGDAPRKD